MKDITREMLKIYKPISGLDWMNYKIVNSEDITAHHIIKKEHGGKLEQSNIALLIKVSHQYLHLIEYKDIETYITINKIFKIVNAQGKEPTKAQRQIIECLLQDFEINNRWAKSSKGSLLLKSKYLKRGAF